MCSKPLGLTLCDLEGQSAREKALESVNQSDNSDWLVSFSELEKRKYTRGGDKKTANLTCAIYTGGPVASHIFGMVHWICRAAQQQCNNMAAWLQRLTIS